MQELKYVGQPVTRIDEREKVLGAAQYVDDLEFGPNLLHAQVVESPYAHAKIISIDTSEAEKIPGVVKVVTGKDFPYHFGLYMQDRYIFAQDKVRFVGEQVAAVIARDVKTAQKAADLVRVQYEPLPAIFDPVEAFKEGATLVHPDLGNYSHVPWFFPKGGTNVAHWRKVRKGNLEQGFAEADLVFEDTYRVPRYAHCCIEVHAAVGLCDQAGRITVWTASQSPHTQRHIFAEVLAPLGVNHKDVRVVTPYVGGGFGGKAGVTMEILAAALPTVVKGHPVKIHWTRAQEFYNTYQRLGVVATLKMGVKKDGSITAFDYTLYWDAGAYVEYGANVVNASGLSATGPYRIPNVKIDALCMYTNLPPGGPYRGFGYSELLFGIESHTTRMAKLLNMDPVEFKRKNAIQEGDSLPYGCAMNPNGLHECIDKVAEAIAWGQKEESTDPHKAIGKGFSIFWKAPAMPANASSAAFLKFNEDASVNILVSAMEIGQGFLTAMAQIAAEILTIPPENIRVEMPDTDRNPYEWQTVASHITWSTGNAVKNAAIDAREQIFAAIKEAYFLETDSLYLDNGEVKCKTQADFAVPLKEIVINGIMKEDGTYRGGPIIGRGTFMPKFTSALGDPETSQGGHPNVHYTVGAAALTLEVDKQTGRMKVLKAVEAIDAGKAINPMSVKDQMIGGLLQGLATVMYEDMRYDEHGKLLNPNFTDYKIPTALDIPDEVIPIIVETPQPDGPFGARGIGEHPMIPAAQIVANALEDAVGIRVKSMPITAEKVGLALQNGKTEVE
ncbi:putative dehydrogenase, molybdenum binding subunit, large chain [Candidatus Vecturithrix granuli]|uniref:Putative dehydrogenase, molybdenum binding subunit, large chain n=1 Tax=Vecturithrix granuli TaxID=1499967 RepID=A0A081C9K4_VECG1|nr:putative dehydrogenase, molybdenum binding subunit, large chain [Candidatus Vecturithrix granuli]